MFQKEVVIKIKKVIKILSVSLTLVLLVGFIACAEKIEKRKIVIGYSNSFYESIWHKRMIEDSMEVFEFYKAREMVDEIIVQHSGIDVKTQIQQIRYMIDQHVDCIIINPSSVSGLIGVITEATMAGIPVIVFDRELPQEHKGKAINIVIDRIEEGYKSSKWMAEKLGGRGKAVLMFGFAGVARTEKRRNGVLRGFGEYHDIEILETVYGQWNQEIAETIMKDVVNAYPIIDAFWAGGSMAMGALRAFEKAGCMPPICSGDPTKEFLIYARKKLDEGIDFEFCCPGNPPGIGGTSLAIAIYLANGYELKKKLSMNTYYYPVKTFVTPDSLNRYLDIMREEPDNAWISEYASDEEIRNLFKYNGVM